MTMRMFSESQGDLLTVLAMLADPDLTVEELRQIVEEAVREAAEGASEEEDD